MEVRKVGGMIAIVGGILGLLAAIGTGLLGSLIGGITDDPRTTEQGVELAVVGVICSILIIIVGGIGIGVKRIIPGIVVVVIAFIAMIGGGLIVASVLTISIAGGIIMMVGRNK